MAKREIPSGSIPCLGSLKGIHQRQARCFMPVVFTDDERDFEQNEVNSVSRSSFYMTWTITRKSKRNRITTTKTTGLNLPG